MKKFVLSGVISTMLLGPWAVAQQQAPPSLDRPAEPNMVFDDDGGKVQFVPADFSPSAEKKFHGGAVMKSAQQVSIFLGSAWADATARARKGGLADVTRGALAPHLAELRTSKVATLPAAPYIDDFTDLSKKALNDLDIQRRLSQMLDSKAIPAPGPSTVYVVFLAPGTVSTLGGHKAGVEYAAYHNVVNLEQGEVRYVVVPFHEDVQHHTSAAARAFAETALNPTGQGWF